MRTRTERFALAGTLAAAALLVAGGASANGRFPAAGHISVDPGDEAHVAVRTTYGLLVTRDGGANWDWICEQAVKWTGQYDPSITITGDGTIIAGIYDHLSVGRGDHCGWSSAMGLDQKNVVDVSTEKMTPASAIALTSNGLGGATFATQVWEAPDNATTWTQAGVDLPNDFQALTVDSAPSSPMRLYVSGLHTGGAQGAIERSGDRGKTWERLDIPGTNADKAPYIAAIDPLDDQVIYVRLTGSPGVLLRSPDGGMTWQDAFQGMGILKGFALSPDGKTILVGGETDGVWRGASDTLQFEKVSSVGVQCLTWSQTAVLACAGELKDNFTVGRSTDQGETFEPMMHLACVRGPLTCAADTEVGEKCPGAWDATAEILDQPSCFNGTGGAGGGGAPDAGPNGGSDDPGSCGCRVARTSGAAGALGGLLGLIAVARRARRRMSRG
jgi:photosystem II stability/assembly factor-like uncharacterized protein